MRDPYGPPTDAQLERAAKIGLTVPLGANKLDVSILLDEAPPSEEQLDLAGTLGIKTDGLAAGELHRKISNVLAIRGAAAFRNNPALREGKSIIYRGEVVVITKIHYTPHKPTVSVRPQGGGKVKVIAAAFLAEVQEVGGITPLVERATRRSAG